MPERPSRQLLVIPPRTLRWPYLLGAGAGVACGAMVLWAVGHARATTGTDTPPAIVDVPPVPPVAETDAGAMPQRVAEPESFAVAPDARPMDQVASVPVGSAPEGGDEAAEDVPAPSANDRSGRRSLSRFSTVDPRLPGDPFMASAPPAIDGVEGPGRVDVTAEPRRAPWTAAAAATGPDHENPGPSADILAAAASDDDDQTTAAGPLASAAAALTPDPTKPAPFAPRDPVALDDPDAPIPVDEYGPATGGPTGLPSGAAGAPSPSPFASAPALGSPPPVAGAPTPPGPPAALPPDLGISAAGRPGSAEGTEPRRASPTGSGQGRPGAAQLDGVQTPQLTIEKRGPREVQVGQTCRYEILVRNVGSAVAQDVIVLERIPFGTTLVATSPPASPAGEGADGDLVWRIGQLPPGSQARVAVELTPTLEGEVGSLASVTFRAEAGARARATKPAVALSAPAPRPVLVGGSMPVVINVTNPGTGTATGVVLEGLVPDGVTHAAGREVEFDVGRLGPGQSRSIELELATTGPGVHQLQLVARADGGIETATQVRLEVTAPTLDLAAEIPSRRYLQRPAPCLLSMTNAGTAPARDVELAAQLPPGLKFIRTNNAGYYDERTHRVLWNLEELPAAETGTVELVVMPVELGPQKIVAAARAAGGLADQAVHTIEVEGLAALTFEVADSEDPIELGGLTEYVVRVVNQGTKAAAGVRLTATLLGEVEPVAAKGPVPHRVDNLAIVFDPLARLAPAEEAVYRVRVRGRREGDQRVQVQLTSDDQPAPITKEEVTRVYADR